VTFKGETMTLEAGAVAISRLDAIRDSSKKLNAGSARNPKWKMASNFREWCYQQPF
jgi:hypothetical protein